MARQEVKAPAQPDRWPRTSCCPTCASPRPTTSTASATGWTARRRPPTHARQRLPQPGGRQLQQLALGLRLTCRSASATPTRRCGRPSWPGPSYWRRCRTRSCKTTSFLSVQYRRLSTTYEQIRANRAQREAFGEQLRAGTGVPRRPRHAGHPARGPAVLGRRPGQRVPAIVAYNNALAGFEFAKGTILQHDNV